MNRKLWIIGLAIWMVLWGILQISNLRFDLQGTVMGILAITVGILAIFDK